MRMAEPNDMIRPPLREMRAENAAPRIAQRVEQRMETLERKMRAQEGRT